MIEILIVHGKMIMGGVEKALLAMLDALEGKGVSVTLLLLKEGGELYGQIPDWVNVEIMKGYEENQFLIMDNTIAVAKKYFKEGKYYSALQAFGRAVAIKISKKDRWYLNYGALLDQLPNQYVTKVVISYRGLDYFVPYYVLEKIKAKHKLVWIHGDVKHHIFENNVIAGKLFPKFDKIYGVSEDVKKSMDEMFPTLKSKIGIFNNLVPESKIKALAEEDGFTDGFSGVKILTVGRLSYLKGQDRIPLVAKKLSALEISFRWYLIGDGEMRTEVESMIAENNMQEHVVLLGNKMNPYPFLKNCDLYVQTSHTEGASVVMHEAKIFERPIVTTDVASAALLIVHGEDGLIVMNNEKGLFDGISALLLHPEKRKSFEKFILKQEQQGKHTVEYLLHLAKS